MSDPKINIVSNDPLLQRVNELIQEGFSMEDALMKYHEEHQAVLEEETPTEE